LRIAPGQIERLGTAGNMSDPWNLAEIQFEGFINQQFAQTSIFAKDEGIIEAGDQKNIVDAKRHQVLETFEPLLRVNDGLGNAWQGHVWVADS
jgi:hypothetical protein